MRARRILSAAKRGFPLGILPYLIAAPIGLGIFAAARSIQVLSRMGFIPSVLLEEALKLVPFLLFALLPDIFRGGRPGKEGRPGGAEAPEPRIAAPLYSTFFFAFVENLAYFLDFPSSDIYWRIGWSLLLHANTAFAYCLATFSVNRGKLARRASERAGLAAGAFILCSAYHALLNYLALGRPVTAILALVILVNSTLFFCGSYAAFDSLVRRRYGA